MRIRSIIACCLSLSLLADPATLWAFNSASQPSIIRPIPTTSIYNTAIQEQALTTAADWAREYLLDHRENAAVQHQVATRWLSSPRIHELMILGMVPFLGAWKGGDVFLVVVSGGLFLV